MTKAERIYKDTRYECKKHVEYWGLGRDDNGKIIGFNSVAVKSNERVSTRTINDLRKWLEADRKQIMRWLEMGIINGDEYATRLETAAMVEQTINNTMDWIAEGRA